MEKEILIKFQETFQMRTGVVVDNPEIVVKNLTYQYGKSAESKLLAYINEGKFEKEIINASVISESWFFRDFDIFYKVLDEYISSYKPNRLDIACIGCAYGQECYSAAMVVASLGIPFKVVGLDMNYQAIELAKNGVYNAIEANDIPIEYQHFISWRDDDSVIEIERDIKKHVEFHAVNILDTKAVNKYFMSFDIIMCRNTLIYVLKSRMEDAVSNIESMKKYTYSPIIMTAKEAMLLMSLITSAQSS